MTPARRGFLKLGAAALAGVGTRHALGAGARASRARVVVIGGGYGGATAARYLRIWAPDIDVVLVEREAQFVSCPLSNLVLSGTMTIADLTVSYTGLRKLGVQVIHDEAVAIDADRRTVRLKGGVTLKYDRLIVAPGVDMMFDQVPALDSAIAQEKIVHAWKAGPQTVTLRRQLEAMPDGGVAAICIPEVPFRCPPAPYERACLVAAYFTKTKPKSKVLVLDGNNDVASEGALFRKAWAELYPGMVEYRPDSRLADVDVATLTAKLELEDVRADVLNVLPPMKAGRIADLAGVVTANRRWCEVDFLTWESKVVKNVHVIGDAIQVAPAMPKSGHMANAQAKACAGAVIALIADTAPEGNPVLTNTCYSFVAPDKVVHVASVHKYDAQQKTILAVPGSGGLSPAANVQETPIAFAWAHNIWADMLG